MARITENTIEKVRLSADIVQTISEYVELKKRGQNFFGICPFHAEKTGSFSVNEDKQIYKCFGCGAGGGVFNFIMDIEKVEFPESIEILASKNGIAVEYEKGASSGYSKGVSSEITSLHELSNKIYINNLNSDIMDYLTGRGLEEYTISEFQIGYSKDSYDQVLKLMQQKKFSTKAMKTCGLFIETKKGYIDRFRNRVMFTIHNHSGKVIAFAGRALSSKDPAKYMNSPETVIYNKSKILYGLWKTKQNITKKKSIIIVEGYMDFLKLYQSGINNIAAISGTSFTDGHAAQIKRLCNKAYLLYDGDSAGRKAAIRAGYICLKFGIEPNIVQIPDKIDPDDWITQSGKDEVQSTIDKGVNVIDFHFKYESEDVESDIGKTKFINDCLIGLRDIQDSIYQELQLKKLSDITGVTHANIINRFNEISKPSKPSPSKKEEVSKSSELDKNINLENDLIKLCFSDNHDARLIIFEKFESEWLKNKINKSIFEEMYIHLKSEHTVDAGLIIDTLKSKEEKMHLSTLLFESDDINLDIKMAKECIGRLKRDFIKDKIDFIRNNLDKSSSDSNKFEQSIIEISQLEKKLNETI